MSAPGEAKVKKHARASGAEPRPNGPVRERGWRPTHEGFGLARASKEAARRRTIAHAADSATQDLGRHGGEAA